LAEKFKFDFDEIENLQYRELIKELLRKHKDSSEVAK
jgi:hypothetical protein